MMVRISTVKFGLLCLTVIIIFTTFLLLRCNTTSTSLAERHDKHLNDENRNQIYNIKKPGSRSLPGKKSNHTQSKNIIRGSHKLAVIIPFRNRFEELMEFVPWIHEFLNKQQIAHQITVVNQVDMHRFNRASLINIGFLKTRDDCDYLVMHDVDLLPNNPDLLYAYPEKGPYHLASPEYHPIYHYKTYIGGVLMMTNDHFEKCRGMSNTFWGWGREDDELYLRFKENSLTLYRPTGLTSGYQTFRHIHDKVKRPRDYRRIGDQKKTQFKRDYITGYDTVQYNLESEREMTIEGAPLKVYNVELYCDKSATPWCDFEKT